MSHAVIDIKDAVPRVQAYRFATPVNFRLMEGEQLAIVGDNGSGKSMLTDIITGAHPILEGREGSYVKYNFAPRASNKVYDNVRTITFQDAYDGTEGYYFYQIRYNQTEIAGHQDLFRLSSGELRRHQLRKAMKDSPRVLILDNPFVGLDVEARRMLDETLSQLTRTTDMQLIVVLSKWDDMPRCITHVVEVRDRQVLPATERDRWVAERTVADTQQTCIVPNLPDEGEPDAAGDTTSVVLDFHNVSIRYGERTILKDLNWTVNSGEHWALTGENGAGKSTLLSLVCADNPQAYANDITLFDRHRGSGESIWDIKRHIGYVSPEMHRAFMRDYKAIDVVGSGLYDTVGLYRKLRDEDAGKCMQWMKVFGVEQYKDTSMLKLSSGEQRLVLLARAFVKAPTLIILDEPLHGLDTTNRKKVRHIIDRYSTQKGKTLIMVTHYEEELPPCIDHHIYLQRNTN